MKRPDQDSAHILIVDDDSRIREVLQAYLVKNGFWCSAANGADQAARVLKMFRIDLIIMDVMMPGEDGISLTARLRNLIDTPVIVLSAKSEVLDRIDGLSAGADDYVPKPFDPQELLLRIEAILRRSEKDRRVEPIEISLSLGAHMFDSRRGELWRGQERVPLTQSEIAVLRLLAKTPNKPVERPTLAKEITGKEFNFQDRGIDVMVSRLRSKFEDDPRNPRFLTTVRGTGYMLVPD